jgi:hypothetical protein
VWNPNDDGKWFYQKPSYREPIVPPSAAPGDAPLACMEINVSWQAILAGAATQLAQPSTWKTTTVDELNTALGKATDLIAIIGTAGLCVSLQMQLTADCKLQYSLDGGSTWVDVTNWPTDFPTCVAGNTPRIQMQAGYTYPPVPEVNGTGDDYVYSPAFP